MLLLSIAEHFSLYTSIQSVDERSKADQCRTRHDRDREVRRVNMDSIYSNLRRWKEEESALREACQHKFQIL